MGYNKQREKAYRKARIFAEESKEKLTESFKFVIKNVDVAAEEVKKMANMSDDQLEEYLKNNGKDILDKIVDAVKKFSGKMEANADIFPYLKKDAEKADNIVELIKAVLDEEELSGWGKYPEIKETLRIWMLKILYSCRSTFWNGFKDLLSVAAVLPVVLGAMAYEKVSTHVEEEKRRMNVENEQIKSNLAIHKKYAPRQPYNSWCWNCHSDINETDERCSGCGWYRCSVCGNCKLGCIGERNSIYDDVDNTYPETYELADKYDCEW